METLESIVNAAALLELSDVQLVSAGFLLAVFVLGNLSGVGLAMLAKGPSEPPANCKRRPRRYAFESVPDSDGMALPSEPTVRARREVV